jgi:hypothetical protein
MAELSRGKTRAKLFPNELNPYDIDSALAVRCADHSVVNMNDNLFNPRQLDQILDFCGSRPRIALLSYTGAGPYPQTYIEDHDLLRKKAEAKKQEFFDRYRKMRDKLNPHSTIPFAGKYQLGGKLRHLNPYRGVADAVEVLSFDPNAFVLADGGKASVDTETLQPTAVRTKPYDESAIAAYLEKLGDRPMDYENYFSGLPENAVPFARLFPKAYANALAKSCVSSDFYYCFRLSRRWFVMNARKGSNEFRFVENVESISPRSELTVDYRYLYGLLTCLFHWNNAEVGSQFMTRRVPDSYSRDAAAFLNYLHI